MSWVFLALLADNPIVLSDVTYALQLSCVISKCYYTCFPAQYTKEALDRNVNGFHKLTMAEQGKNLLGVRVADRLISPQPALIYCTGPGCYFSITTPTWSQSSAGVRLPEYK